MTDPKSIRTAFERNARAVALRPAVGQGTGLTKVRLRDGTTCEIEGSGWKLTADVGVEAGGNNAGPGPGVLERAALGSCLAIGYSTWAARLDVPIEDLEVEVETDFDARGMLAVEKRPPGFTTIRYRVIIQSPASKSALLQVLNQADAHSPVLDDFSRAIPIKRETKIINSLGTSP